MTLPKVATILALLTAAIGCEKNRTEIVLGMATDLSASTPLSTVELQVFSLPDDVLIADQQLPISGTINAVYELPGTYAVYSAGGSADRFRALLTATDNSGATLVVRSAVLSLVPQKTLFARLGVVSACEGMTDCGTGQTCIEGHCASEEIDSSRLPEYTPGMENDVACPSATTFVDTSTKLPLEVTGTSCGAGTCLEGVCLAPAQSDAGSDSAATAYTSTKEIGSTYLSGPQNIFIEPATQNILAADFATGGVVELSNDGTYLKTFGNSGAGQLAEASGITEDPQGNIYVGDYGASTIVKFANDGTYLATFPSTIGTVTLVEPAAVAADAAGNIWIANDGVSQVVELDGAGNLVFQFSTTQAAQGGGLAGTVGLALDATGNVWVADYYYHSVVEYSPTGTLLAQVGSYGTTQAAGVFSEPYAIAVDATGRIYVADIANNDVQIMDSAGNVTAILTATSTGPLSGPSGVAIDKKGLVYVSDGANVIHVFAPSP